MKTQTIMKTAGLALAISALPLGWAARAQSAATSANTTTVTATAQPNKRIERIEVHTDDDNDAPLAVTRSGGGEFGSNFGHTFAFSGDGSGGGVGFGGSAERPLIISASSLEDKSLAHLDEDLTIMARILGKSADRGGGENPHEALNIQLWTVGGGNRGARNMYIDGYGAVFIVNVNMPLLQAQAAADKEEKKEVASSTWEEARNELFGGGDDERAPKRVRLSKERGQSFDQGRFDKLKSNLTDALKNGSHIRGLKDSEYVTIVVQGPATEGSEHRLRVMSGGGGNQFENFVFAGPNAGGGARSVLTLRAKKSDIDAFAKGKLDGDEFRKKVSAASYQTSGGGDNPRAR